MPGLPRRIITRCFEPLDSEARDLAFFLSAAVESFHDGAFCDERVAVLISPYFGASALASHSLSLPYVVIT